MSQFYNELLMTLVKSLGNNYQDNYDEDRFGKLSKSFSFYSLVSSYLLEKRYESLDNFFHLESTLAKLQPQLNNIQFLYDNLANDQSKQLLIQILCYRILGYRKVKLPANTDKYWSCLEKLKAIGSQSVEKINLQSTHYVLSRFNLREIEEVNQDIKLFITPSSVLAEFILEQYAYRKGSFPIQACEGDTVIDAGGCWGDTALYFADKVKGRGKVYCHEFVPSNIEVIHKNLKLNPHLSPLIEIVPHPLWSVPDRPLYYQDKGPGTRVSFRKNSDDSGVVMTETIDHFVATRKIERVDFIKMDIEGAEEEALKGAQNTISASKPKLAISIYHNIEHFYTIPKLIREMNPAYSFFLDHYTLHSEETVLFAA